MCVTALPDSPRGIHGAGGIRSTQRAAAAAGVWAAVTWVLSTTVLYSGRENAVRTGRR